MFIITVNVKFVEVISYHITYTYYSYQYCITTLVLTIFDLSHTTDLCRVIMEIQDQEVRDDESLHSEATDLTEATDASSDDDTASQATENTENTTGEKKSKYANS